MLGTPDYFDFLRLPREIRDRVYEYALCSFSGSSLYNLEQCARVYMNLHYDRRQFTGNLNLLLANRQIHNDGYMCMVSRNQFVIVELEDLLAYWTYGHTPIYILSSRFKTEYQRRCLESYPWYMRIKIKGKEKRRTVGEFQEDFSLFTCGAVMLWEDCVDMLKRYGNYPTQSMGSDLRLKYTPYQNPMRLIVDLNPTKRDWGGKDSYTDLWTAHFAINQKKLLGQIKDALFGCNDLEIMGCDDEEFAAEVIREVAKVPSITLASFRPQLEEHARNAENSWRLGNITECANFCNKGIHIVVCAYTNRSIISQLCENGFEHCFETARPIHTLHVLLARCLYTHLSTLFDDVIDPDCHEHIGKICLGIMELFDYLHKLVPNYLPRHHPTPHEEAEEYYMRAKGLRALFEYAPVRFREDLVSYAEKATRLCPDNPNYKEEVRKAKAWIPEYQQFEAADKDYTDRTLAKWRTKFLPTAFEY